MSVPMGSATAATEVMDVAGVEGDGGVNHPMAPSLPPEDPKRPTVLWLVLGIAALVVIGFGLVAGALFAGRSSESTGETTTAGVETSLVTDDAPLQTDESAGTSDQPASDSTGQATPSAGTSGNSGTSVTTAAASTATTQAPASVAAGPIVDEPQLLLAFADAWTSADWDRMQTMANDDVISVAKEWSEAGGSAGITAENIDIIREGCYSPAAGRTSCEFLYVPAEGYGLIFTATYVTADDGLMVVDLVFGGDAG